MPRKSAAALTTDASHTVSRATKHGGQDTKHDLAQISQTLSQFGIFLTHRYFFSIDSVFGVDHVTRYRSKERATRGPRRVG